MLKQFPIPKLSKNNLFKFISRVVPSKNCWNWNGRVHKSGYGVFSMNSKWLKAHRVSYSHFRSKLVDGLTIDHICENKICVNPYHLRQVTTKTNVLSCKYNMAALNKRKVACPKGHLYAKKNVVLNNKGSRTCRECKLDYQRKYNLKSYVKKMKHQWYLDNQASSIVREMEKNSLTHVGEKYAD